MNQCVPFHVATTPCLHDLAERGVAAMAGAETVGAAGEPGLVVRLQQQSHNFGDSSSDQVGRPIGRRFPLFLGM